METDKLRATIAIIVALTLCLVALILSLILVVGLFFTNFDSTIILRIMQPAFQTIIGGFVGLLAGIKLGK